MIDQLVIQRQVHGQPDQRAERAAARQHAIRHHRAAHQRQRQERLIGPLGVPDEAEAERNGAADHRQNGRRQPGQPVAAPGQDQHEHDGRGHQQQAAGPVDLAQPVIDRQPGHLGQQQCQRGNRERDVDPEDHRPVQVVGEEAADNRPEQAGEQPDTTEIGLVLTALAGADHVRDHRLDHRHDAAAAEPLQAAGEDQDRHVRRQRADHRADDEQAERRDDHGAAAIDVAERAEHRRHRGRGQQIGGDHP